MQPREPRCGGDDRSCAERIAHERDEARESVALAPLAQEVRPARRGEHPHAPAEPVDLVRIEDRRERSLARKAPLGSAGRFAQAACRTRDPLERAHFDPNSAAVRPGRLATVRHALNAGWWSRA